MSSRRQRVINGRECQLPKKWGAERWEGKDFMLEAGSPAKIPAPILTVTSSLEPGVVIQCKNPGSDCPLVWFC